jgi:hypothetical protein
MYNWFIGRPYAQRETSAAVLQNQLNETLANSDNLTATLIQMLTGAGYESSMKAYYQRIYDAKKAGNEQAAQSMIDYLLNAKGREQKDIDSAIKSLAKKDENMDANEKADFMLSEGMDPSELIINQVRSGEMTAEDARKRLKEANPKADDHTIWWKGDRAEYKRDTGKDAGSGTYYRLKDAIEANKSQEIKDAVATLLKHGVTKEKVKNKLSDWKSAYMNATGNEKVAIKNALIIAYKAAGYPNAETEIINKWKPAKQKSGQ